MQRRRIDRTFGRPSFNSGVHDRDEKQRLVSHSTVHSIDVPVFDRADRLPHDPETDLGLETATGFRPRRRTGADRAPAGRVVTGTVLGDPKPERAGRAPDCEESLRLERSKEAYRLLGKEPPGHDDYGVLDLDEVRSRQELLKPRRWQPPFKAAAE